MRSLYSADSLLASLRLHRVQQISLSLLVYRPFRYRELVSGPPLETETIELIRSTKVSEIVNDSKRRRSKRPSSLRRFSKMDFKLISLELKIHVDSLD